MENESSIKEIISNALQEVRSILDADTIVGQPIRLENGMTIIPVSKVSMGFASGGLDLPQKGEDGKKNFGGGGGTGVTVAPIGFLTAYPDGKVEFLPVKQDKSTPIEQVADLINKAPDIIERIKNVLGGKKPAETEADLQASETVEQDLTDKVLQSMAKEEDLALEKEAKQQSKEDKATDKAALKEERQAAKAAKKAERAQAKEAAREAKEAKKEAERRRASFDYADED